MSKKYIIIPTIVTNPTLNIVAGNSSGFNSTSGDFTPYFDIHNLTGYDSSNIINISDLEVNIPVGSNNIGYVDEPSYFSLDNNVVYNWLAEGDESSKSIFNQDIRDLQTNITIADAFIETITNDKVRSTSVNLLQSNGFNQTAYYYEKFDAAVDTFTAKIPGAKFFGDNLGTAGYVLAPLAIASAEDKSKETFIQVTSAGNSIMF
ncbi:MAG: hypothetical protein PQ612_09620 [Rickettsiales bacterium]|nr:hypothetical protein [Pseudomonadota bacterium]MDA0966052.1 hypothetical protein [Pseudomonadota bacterium]MDG4544234.1 hypothetical protein [Rickettsiales bacterium]MDG4546413.1 hypothetical protein [Rickettsiales bacterium]MDG4548558.1 hypothetical protein [Rickettsiales bacterium]